MFGLLIALGIVLAASSAGAHAKFVRSSPSAQSVGASPPEIRLTFNEPVEAKLSGIELKTSAGEPVATEPASADGTELVVPLREALLPGAYYVHWHIVSEDMHKVAGDFNFEVRP